MSTPIFVVPSPPAAPTPPTTVQLQAQLQQQVKNKASQAFQQMVRQQNDGINAIWHNPNGLTPQQAVDALGTDAARIFAAHGALTNAVVAAVSADNAAMTALNPAYVPVAAPILKPTFTWTVNSNGTITIGTTPYTS